MTETKSEEKKPREFWIYDKTIGDCEYWIACDRKIGGQPIHAIEYRAYTALLAKHERTLEMLTEAEKALEFYAQRFHADTTLGTARDFEFAPMHAKAHPDNWELSDDTWIENGAKAREALEKIAEMKK